MNGRCALSILYTWRSARISRCGLTEKQFRGVQSVLLICDCQKDAIIHGNRARKKGGGVCAHNGNVVGIAAQRRASGPCGGSGPITRLKRNASGLRRAVRCADTRVADEHLAIAAVGAASGSL